jgi:NitT/TauT family transport system substrate-binding protein
VTPINRRGCMTLVAATALASSPLAASAQVSPRRLRMLLNTTYSGPQAWLLLARDNGHLAREGLEIDFTTGAGAYTAAPRMVEGSYDLAYGDVNSLIEVAARQPQAAPVGVYMLFNASPSTIAVRADGPIRTPKDLEGRTIVGHSSDVALHTFGAFCSATGVDRSRVRVQTSLAGMRSMAEQVLRSDDVHGMFGYVSTIVGATASAGPAVLAQLRFLKYAEFVPDLYGSVLMASRRLLRDEPDTVARVVRAFNRGLADMLREPLSGIEAVARQASGIDRDAERQRLQATLDIEMGHADGRTLGIGDVDDARLARAIDLIARSNDLPRVPALRDVFVRDHLPPPVERVRTVDVALPALAQAVTRQRRLRLLLNTSLSGPVAFFLFAQDRGYLRDEGLEITLAAGGGAAAIVPQVVHGAYDIGYGDISALIERIARGERNQGPVAIYTTFNVVPFTIAVAADGPIRAAKDLEGRRIVGHAGDAALLTFDLYARAAGIDINKVAVVRSMQGMGAQVADMLGGSGADAVFGFVNTLIASAAPLGIDGRKSLRFLNFAEHLPDMYGNTLFVTRELYLADPAALRGMVRAFNRALADTVKDPDAAIDALARHAPGADRAVNHARLVGTLRGEMAHPEGGRIGIGDMDHARLARLIVLIVETKKLPRLPAPGEVFDRSFLPPEAQRIRSLAR